MTIAYQRRGKQKRQDESKSSTGNPLLNNHNGDGRDDVEAVNITQKSLQREPFIAPKRQRGKEPVSLWTAFAFISIFVASIYAGYNLGNNNLNNSNRGFRVDPSGGGRDGQSPDTLQIQARLGNPNAMVRPEELPDSITKHSTVRSKSLLKSRCTPPNSHLSPRLNSGGARGRGPLRPKNQKTCNSKI